MKLPTSISGAGPPAIIQGPGWGPSSDYLRITLAPLFPDLRVLTYDVRNTGRAPRVPEPGSQVLEVLAADLEQVRKESGLEQFVLFGHSHGASIAMAYALRHGASLRGLVLIAPSLDDPDPTRAAPDLLERYARDPQRAAAVRSFREGWRSARLESDRDLARWMRLRMPLNFHDLDVMARFRRQLNHSPVPSIDAFRGVPREREKWLETELPSIRVPTLIIVGAQDVTTPPVAARKIASRIVGAQLEVLDRAGHSPWVERPEEFTHAVRRFLAAL